MTTNKPTIDQLLQRNKALIKSAMLYRVTELQTSLTQMQGYLAEEYTMPDKFRPGIAAMMSECRQMLIDYSGAYEELRKAGFFD